jgi:hypothetical protein
MRALLAFLQAIWGKADTRPLIIGALFGIVSFALGVSLGALTYIWRHLAFSGGERNWWRRLRGRCAGAAAGDASDRMARQRISDLYWDRLRTRR